MTSPAPSAPINQVPSANASVSSAPLDSLPISDTLILEALNIRAKDLKDVLQGLALQFNINFLISPDVNAQVTCSFNHIPVKQAVSSIIMDAGLAWEKQGSAIRVYKPKPAPVVSTAKMDITFENGKLSLDLKDADLAEVVRKISLSSGKNLTLEPGNSPKVSLTLKNADWNAAIKTLASTLGMLTRDQDGITQIYRSPWNMEGMGSGGTGMPGTPGMSNSSVSQGGRSSVQVQVKDSLISLDLQNAPLTQVIGTLVSQGGFNAVFYGTLKGNVTAKLRDIPLKDALKFLFRDSESTFWFKDGVLFIGPKNSSGGVQDRLIRMKYIKAEEALSSLPADMTKSNTIKVIKSQNALMAQGTYEDLDILQSYIEQIDQPVPMILLETLVVDIDLDKVRDYGINLFIGKPPTTGTSEALYPNVSQVFNRDQANDFLSMIGLKNVVDLPKNFVGQIHALEQEKALKVRSRPIIATLNGQTATISVGQSQYYLLKTETDMGQNGTITNRVSENFTKIDANVTLTVTPFVTGKGEVTCEIDPDFSEPEGSFDSKTPPTINHRTLKSNVKLHDGETIILGGLVKESKQDVTSQVPFLGSIPFLGWLFKNANIDVTRTQLVIFVTPHIYYDSDSKVDVEKVLEKYAQ